MDKDDLFKAFTQSSPGISNSMQVSILRELFAKLQVGKYQVRFNPGQMLRHRFPAQVHLLDPQSPRVFLEYLNEPFDPTALTNPDLNAIATEAAGRVYDCRLGMLCDQGHLIQHLGASQEFEPYARDAATH